MRPPAFQFYADDFIAGVADMTQNEVGAYIMLLAHGWNTQGLKAADTDRLKLLAKGDVSDHVLGKFKLKNGKLYNKRQEHERQKQEVYRTKQALNGAKGGRPKKEAKPNPSLSFGLTQPEPKKSSPSPSPSPSPVSVEIESVGGCSNDASSIASSMTPINYYEQIDARAGALFGRTTPANAYAEQSAISEISRRLDALGELAEIEAFHRKPGNFFPQSLSKLLSAWQETLDRARTHDKRKQNHATDNRTGEKRIDRSIGTANEGIANQYKEFADRKAGRVGAVAKAQNV
jgi:uncharacterized protein YdaU (DUF1376 family)